MLTTSRTSARRRLKCRCQDRRLQSMSRNIYTAYDFWFFWKTAREGDKAFARLDAAQYPMEQRDEV